VQQGNQAAQVRALERPRLADLTGGFWLGTATLDGVSAILGDSPSTASERSAGSALPAIAIKDVNKTFRLPQEQYHTLKERALHPFRTCKIDVLRAVDNVNIEIAQGEFFGIVGRNGSGKSTLLKCLAGIYAIDDGTIEINGRLSPFIELGVGFNPDLTARDNVLINAIVLGLSRKQARERFDQIVAFAELEEFMDLKLKNYSSGMHVRLAFSVAIQVDAEIVLIDEVLAVGDASFQQKCFDEFIRLKAEGRTIVFVTHDMASVEHFCDRAMLLERGRVVDVGDPGVIAREYNRLNFRLVREEATLSGGPEVLRRAPVAELISASFESPDGKPLVATQQGDACAVRIEIRFHADAENPIFAMALRDSQGHSSFATSTALSHGPTGQFRAGQSASVRIAFENWLAPGRYSLEASVSPDGLGANAYDLREALSSIIVHATKSGGGAADLPHSIEIERE
jgi:ABC-type polysaccharide/polyol phosphate transport system ATPase subunit